MEPVWLFYPAYVAETLKKGQQWLSLYWHMRTIYRRIKRDPERGHYMDKALAPVADDETDSGELFQSEKAQAYVRQERRLGKIRSGELV